MLTLLEQHYPAAVVLPFWLRKGKGMCYYLSIGMLAELYGIFPWPLTGDSACETASCLRRASASLGLLVVVLVVALALYALSWRLSVAWYGKAEQ